MFLCRSQGEERYSHPNPGGIGEHKSVSNTNTGDNPHQVRKMKEVQEFLPQANELAERQAVD